MRLDDGAGWEVGTRSQPPATSERTSRDWSIAALRRVDDIAQLVEGRLIHRFLEAHLEDPALGHLSLHDAPAYALGRVKRRERREAHRIDGQACLEVFPVGGARTGVLVRHLVGVRAHERRRGREVGAGRDDVVVVCVDGVEEPVKLLAR